MGQMRCRQCGDVIGYYEPLVLLERGQARASSAAAEPQLGNAPGERFHRACYVETESAASIGPPSGHVGRHAGAARP